MGDIGSYENINRSIGKQAALSETRAEFIQTCKLLCMALNDIGIQCSCGNHSNTGRSHWDSLIPRPHPAFRRFLLVRGRAWERGQLGHWYSYDTPYNQHAHPGSLVGNSGGYLN